MYTYIYVYMYIFFLNEIYLFTMKTVFSLSFFLHNSRSNLSTETEIRSVFSLFLMLVKKECLFTYVRCWNLQQNICFMPEYPSSSEFQNLNRGRLENLILNIWSDCTSRNSSCCLSLDLSLSRRFRKRVLPHSYFCI